MTGQPVYIVDRLYRDADGNLWRRISGGWDLYCAYTSPIPASPRFPLKRFYVPESGEK